MDNHSQHIDQPPLTTLCLTTLHKRCLVSALLSFSWLSSAWPLPEDMATVATEMVMATGVDTAMVVDMVGTVVAMVDTERDTVTVDTEMADMVGMGDTVVTDMMTTTDMAMATMVDTTKCKCVQCNVLYI